MEVFQVHQSRQAATQHCTHCGDTCPDNHPVFDQLPFCCQGCEMVYIVLKENGLSDYYAYTQNPGATQKSATQKNYTFLDDADVVSRLLSFQEQHLCKITFTLPQIHCASCVWLLEHINKLHAGILGSRVNFLARTATISYDPGHITLRELVETLARIGYAPELNLQKLDTDQSFLTDRTIYYKLGLAGFAFGNIMLLSFPEYLGFEEASVNMYIGYINIVLSLPVILYSGFDYLRSAWWTLRLRQINIDIPIAVGMLTLFFRSVYEIISTTGEGYLDSLAGFIFFLLVGKWFQQYTFHSISFDRNYKSYFPISALVRQSGNWQSRSLDKLEAGDELMVRHEEIIPGDGKVLHAPATIDYSFVTGESAAIEKQPGNTVFAGGKVVGSPVQMVLTRKPDHSYLASLWDEDAFRIDKESKTQTLIAHIGKYFTATILSVAVLTLIYWLTVDKSLAFNAFTAVLIVACPCALALALPFSYGNILRLLGRRFFYLKNVQVIDRIQLTDHIIFDKTGTITDHRSMVAHIQGDALQDKEKQLVKSAVFRSSHPLSKALYAALDGPADLIPDQFEEVTGQGIVAKFSGVQVKIGSPSFIFGTEKENIQGVVVEIDGLYKTWFQISHQLREGVVPLIHTLSKKYSITILSGDNNREEDSLKKQLPPMTDMIFYQSPKDKLAYVQKLQANGARVMMVGDGLNDAGALMQSDVGIVISEDSNNFTPACDAILGAAAFPQLLKYLTYLQKARKIIIGAFVLAFLYNVAGLYFAVQGALSPVVAAILMPLSSVTVMTYGLLASSLGLRWMK